MRYLLCIFILLAAGLLAGQLAEAAAPTTIDDFFLPGSQPLQSGNIEHPDKCDNCHGGYDQAVEPAFNWRGSMMAQAARDPLYLACLAIANQDAPESGDLCIRCHSPDGWLGGRSIPTDGSLLNNNDREGVQCDFCHKLVDPAAAAGPPYPDDPDYVADTFPADQAYLALLGEVPPASADGMYVADSDNAKRGPYVDAAARHQMFYSPFHREAALCGTCHDVSNPAFSRTGEEDYTPNDFGTPAGNYDPYSLFPIERTYSEWLNSDYASPTGVYAPQFGGNLDWVSTCQDCHMRDVTGVGCNKRGAPVRDDLPLHDMTGGNTFIPILVEQLFPSEVNPAALAVGVSRARSMLQKAASLDVTISEGTGDYVVTVQVTNETGHKLPSGYPEGRRIWINLQAFDGSGTLVYESGAYDFATAELAHDPDAKIYHIEPGLSPALAGVLDLTPGPSFHFAVNDTIYYDNRIPPRGFTNAAFAAIQSAPVDYSYEDGQYWDDTVYHVPATTAEVVATLYYQTTSKEYVTFLRDENVTNDAGQVLYNLWAANGMSAPEVMNQVTVPVGLAPPVADFEGSPVSGTAPLTVAFTDLSTGSPETWSWDFGDGQGSGEQNPTHTYTAAGTYTVALTVNNAAGSDTAVRTDYIEVTGAGATVMHVADLVVTREAAGSNRQQGVATVTIVDQSDAPVAGATVTGDFSGPTSGSRSGVTDGNGVAIITSRGTKNHADEWCFTVTDVALAGATYDPAANVITAACESGPLGKSSNGSALVATEFGLTGAHPNPFNPVTTIAFRLVADGQVQLDVFDLRGHHVARLVDGPLTAGDHRVKWDAREFASGTYLCRLISGNRHDTSLLTLVK